MQGNAMIENTKKKEFNYSLFVAFILLNFIPTIYETVKIFFVNNTATSLSVVSQIEWFEGIEETIRISLIMPLYFLLSKYKDDKDVFKEKVFHSGIITFVLYSIFSAVVYFYIDNLIVFMNAESSSELTKYLQLETIAFVVNLLYAFASVVFTILGKEKYIYGMLVVKMVGLVVADFFFIHTYGSFGIAYANIFTNTILVVCSLVFILKEDCISFSFKTIKDKMFLKDWFRVGKFQAGQIGLDNLIYNLMIMKMINEVQQASVYWIANSFIWGWLLVPSHALAEIIKRDCKHGYATLNHKAYIRIIVATVSVWVVSIPLWNSMFTKLMGIENPSDVFYICICLLPFYVAYLVSAYIDNIFYGLGKTKYTMAISIFVNIVYYGIVYVLFKNGVFQPSINFIILMFGIGNVVHVVLSIIIKRVCLDSKNEMAEVMVE